jgi:hypothetical protein
MKYLKKFENFTGYDLGRFSEEEELLNQPKLDEPQEDEDEYCAPCEEEEEELEEDEMEFSTKPRVWGDEVVEGKKAKPDFLDLDKDGNKKESMKKAAKDAKDSKKDDKKEDEKGGKGLSKAQQKLPAGLRKAIEAKNKKK